MGCGQSAVADSSDLPADPKPSEKPRYSVISLQIPNGKDDDALSATSGMSEEPPAQKQCSSTSETLCNTEVSLEWLLKILKEHFPINEEPQWIAERLNKKPYTEIETSSVIRVTFAWDSELPTLPKTVIVKVPLSKGAREDDMGRFHYALYKRECNAYEWIQRISNLQAPQVFTIKKHGNEDGGAAIVLEDLGEKYEQKDVTHGLSEELVHHLLNQLAFLHAQSWRETHWTTLVADLPSTFYNHEAGNWDEIAKFFTGYDVEASRMLKLKHYFSAEYLQNTVTESNEELKTSKVLVHGEPLSSNIFVDEGRIAGIVDWTGCHAGCFGEDLAKAICWNLSVQDRIKYTSGLLQAYHYQLVLHSGNTSITAELVRASYEKFVPVAMVSYVHKVMLFRERPNVEPLIERAKGLINQLYSTIRMREEMNDHR